MQGYSFGQQYFLQKGLKMFGDRGIKAVGAEMEQLHIWNCFEPLLLSSLIPSEKEKALKARLMFLTEKHDKNFKGQMVANGKPTREWHTREEATGPTASLERIFLMRLLTQKRRETFCRQMCQMHSFIQTTIPEGEERVVMKVDGPI
jgi:hypothetical protein